MAALPMHEPLSDDLRRFILTSVPSVPYLEAILQFHAPPRAPRSAASLAAVLYIGEPAAQALITALAVAGIVRKLPHDAEDRHEYAPAEPAMAAMIDRLVRAYTSDLVGVTRLIHDATQRSAQRFSDAFKFGKGS
jgi:hypothetical protein